MSRRKRPMLGSFVIREALASVRLDRDETIDLGPPRPFMNPAVADGSGLGERLRELSAEVADGGRVWCSALDNLAEQADALELDRVLWRSRIKRVRAEAASWERPDGPGEPSAITATALWCAERIRFALDG